LLLPGAAFFAEEDMKVTLMMIESLDGRTTEGDSPAVKSWASAEDQDRFLAIRAAHDRIVMGSTTYEAVRGTLRLDPNKPRVIITRNPAQYADEVQPGLVFTDESPAAVVEQARQDGCQSLLLVGGAQTNARFLDARLVDELLVTIEPLLFGSGLPLVQSLQQTLQLQLISCEQLNARGTLLAHYQVQKS
jgi:dihydrofolate reductase